MPHAVLQGEAGLDALLAGWHTQTWQETHDDVPVVIKLLDVYRRANGDGGLFELLVKEGPLSQQLAVALYPQDNGRWLLKPSAIGFPRPTWGVKRAVWRLAQALRERHRLQVVSSTVGYF